MKKITDSTVRLDSIVENVSSKISLVDTGSTDISYVMEELNSSMEEIAATAASLETIVDELMKEVEQFKLK